MAANAERKDFAAAAQHAPEEVSHRKVKDDERGGHDCEFVEPPPASFQTECPICLLILREPCVISCPCGQKMCSECVERIKKEGKPCPLCNKTDFSFMRDYGLERYMKEFEVRCSHVKDDCEWRGELGEFEQHLNRNPSPENQLDGCQFVGVECKYVCGGWYRRCDVSVHQIEHCMKRPYSCGYCQVHESTFKEVTDIHYAVCPKCPVVCPNECRHDPFERQEIEGHLKDDCTLTKVSCPLHYAGCEVELPRKDMPEHMKDTVTHLTLLANVTLKENQELKEVVGKKNQQIDEMAQEVHELRQRMTASEAETRKSFAGLRLKEVVGKKNQQIDEMAQEVHELRQRMTASEAETRKSFAGLRLSVHDKFQAHDKVDREVQKCVQELTFHKLGLPVSFRVRQDVEEVALPPFYTHSHGYKFRIDVCPQGYGDGEGTHVSIYACLMKGQFDDHLKWPFRGEITIQIVNQDGDHDHVEKTIPYNDDTPDAYAGRVTGKNKASEWGLPEFFLLAHLGYNRAKKTQYGKDGVIIVRVVKVSLL